ncbi:uncharacterized protein Z520_01646 [Fonsecaea multimorphosa CBS 102226]|uniref:BolA protein n=1 Tax=Fonsecaea multimorphosa CBS 102226 TaxID=1442371 RepID=A0A0D2L287_9EURO|nr:uncharacterized protein Z520_01646 [Fonsecaea multimorphosa CBS 102226]KIY03179.1 hypothetical protein Z520_01646 [Fonsecaea multimorphosa CBS 102226]
MQVYTALALQAARRVPPTIIRANSSITRQSPLQRLRLRPRPFLSRSFSITTHSSSSNSPPMAAHTDTEAAEVAASSSPPITPEYLTEKLKQSINITHISMEDMSGGCGQAFNAIIVSPEFEKKTLLARSRLVNGVLKDEIRAIHAWTPKCLTPEQWEKEKERIG